MTNLFKRKLYGLKVEDDDTFSYFLFSSTKALTLFRAIYIVSHNQEHFLSWCKIRNLLPTKIETIINYSLNLESEHLAYSYVTISNKDIKKNQLKIIDYSDVVNMMVN